MAFGFTDDVVMGFLHRCSPLSAAQYHLPLSLVTYCSSTSSRSLAPATTEWHLFSKNGEEFESFEDFVDVGSRALERHLVQQLPDLLQLLLPQSHRVDVLLAVVQQRQPIPDE